MMICDRDIVHSSQSRAQGLQTLRKTPDLRRIEQQASSSEVTGPEPWTKSQLLHVVSDMFGIDANGTFSISRDKDPICTVFIFDIHAAW